MHTSKHIVPAVADRKADSPASDYSAMQEGTDSQQRRLVHRGRLDHQHRWQVRHLLSVRSELGTFHNFVKR